MRIVATMYISLPEESILSHRSPSAQVLRICVRSKKPVEERHSDVEQGLKALRAARTVHRNQARPGVKFLLLGLALAISFSALTQTRPPVAPDRDVVDTHFGVRVRDAYQIG